MKNILDKKFYVMLIGLLFFAPACTDLDEELFSDVTDENFFQSDDEFISALGGAYSSFYGIGNHSNLWSSNEIASDEMVITTKGGDWYDGGILLQLHQHNWTPDNGFFNNTWGFLYSGINTANRLIAQFENIESDNSTAYINELRAVRAIWYMWAMDAFGNVPLVTGFSDDVPKNDSDFQTGRTAVYTFVETELVAVIADLDASVGGNAYARVNQATAWAALAKLYINAEVYSGGATTEWAKAINAVDQVETFGYSLEGLYSSNFKQENSGSTENIFVVPYDKVFAQGFNWPMMTLHYASQSVFEFTEQPWNGYATVEEFYNSYIDTVNNPGTAGAVWSGLATPDPSDLTKPNGRGTLDSRLSNFLVGPQLLPDNTQAEDPAADEDDPDGAGLNFTPQHNTIYPNGWRQGGARIGKYNYEQGGTNSMSNDFVIYRWGDMKLIRAEANLRLGNDALALAEVNEIRVRAEVTPFAALTLDNLLAERGREMFAELSRRQDLIRFGKFNDAWWEKEVSTSTYNVFPIPQPQIDVNSTLVQNPGY
ncbi:RagB/SusD family nutrient uptake outer membrane protein [Cyclobacteriaceae bacterium]|nr:RagB/SusD family nutrient uptake outer membrane protein [Cyclobacteriaceae bacterium]MDB4316154.1 RagB/SusD family nutrient uptake outer membrane protein [Cyclobacteriaceae bacterium]MDB4603587.1 RagB/SusD family nutrient uptake outer membrane protein [Cyclobacteriaceae bacterium]